MTLRTEHAGAVVPYADLDRSLAFYRDRLGLDGEPVPGGYRLDCGGGSCVYLLEAPELAGTASWPLVSFRCHDLAATVAALRAQGVEPQRFDDGSRKTDPRGIARLGQLQIAWIVDPDGQVVSLFQPVGASVLEGTLPRLDGRPQDLGAYHGNVALVVNTASRCGLTPQYAALQALYERRRGDGLVVLGFPSADFGGQELDDDGEIAAFCQANYGVTFPLFARSHVVGEQANPLFRRLNDATAEPDWNFAKYLVDRAGRVVQRFDAQVEPDDPAVTTALDQLLGSPA